MVATCRNNWNRVTEPLASSSYFNAAECKLTENKKCSTVAGVADTCCEQNWLGECDSNKSDLEEASHDKRNVSYYRHVSTHVQLSLIFEK